MRVECLERRRLFASVTLITHGYESGDDRPGWIDAMKDAIVSLAGTGTAVYDLRIAEDHDGDPIAESFTHVGGPGFTDANGNGDAVVMLDWADASGVISFNSTSVIAALVKPFFVNAYPDLGIASPLAEVPIHLIGHSRGGSLVSALAMDLGRDGIEVDQVTTLDPHPVGKDASVRTYANTRFADNDWQDDGGLLTLDGQKVEGAHNLHLDDDVLGRGAYHTVGDGGDHVNVRLWYHGTVDTSPSAGDGTYTVPADWYPSQQGPRAQVGFAYSLLATDLGVGTSRPADGTGTSFGGSASRAPITLSSAAQWANIGGLHLTTAATSAAAGDALAAQFDLWDNDTATSHVTLYLDADTDPFNADSTDHPITANDGYATTASDGHPTIDVPLYTALVPAGTYHPVAMITDGQHTRYAYAPDTFTLTPAVADPLPIPDPATSRALSPNSGPDFTIALGASTPSSLVAGGKPFPQRVTIQNAGNTSGKGKTTVNIYASTDGTLDSADTLVATKFVTVNLTPGKTAAATLNLTSPNDIPAGDYHLIAQVIPAIAETNAANDTAATPGTVAISPPRVDLAGAFSSTPILVAKGKNTAVITITNQGNVTAKGRVALQILNHFDGSTVGSTAKSVSLGVGKSLTLKVPLSLVSITGLLDGTFGFTGSLADADLSNNAFTSPVTG